MKGYIHIPKIEPREVSILAICMNCNHTWRHTYTTDSIAISNSTTYHYCDNCYDSKTNKVIAGRAKGASLDR